VYFLQNGAYANSHSGIAAPYGVAIDQITHRLYIANRGESHAVTLLDVDPNWIMGTIDVGQEPYVLGVNSRTGHVFVSLGDRVYVYDRRDNALITSIPVGTGAEEGMAVDPARGLVYVTSRDTDEVTVIQDIATLDLAYVTNRLSANQQPQSDIFVSDDTGHHVSQLTQATGDLELNGLPAFHPGGKRLAFVSTRDTVDHGRDIFTMELTGHNQVNLTNDGGDDDTEPAWSPDGARIAWRRDWNIWVMNADGSDKQPLTSGLSARTPKWSPDGQWICFLAWPPGEMYNMDVYLVPANGGPIIDVTNNPKNDLQPSWSPDSQEIAFETDRHSVFSDTSVITTNWEIYKVNINTLVQTRLTDDPEQDHDATWSPDGTTIAFISNRSTWRYETSLWIMNPDGSQQQPLTGQLQLLDPISWSPDSKRIAIQSGLGSDGNILLIDVPSGSVQPLTNTPLEDAQPAWRPDTWK
jgi:TolB protein